VHKRTGCGLRFGHESRNLIRCPHDIAGESTNQGGAECLTGPVFCRTESSDEVRSVPSRVLPSNRNAVRFRRSTRLSGALPSATTPEEAPERVYEDRSLTCRDCSEEFIFSSGEQAFFSSKGLLNDPQRCPACRAVAKQARTSGGPREFHAAVCGSCGGQAMVPFAPRNDRPVYCSSCFDKVRAGTLSESASV
jgi:CxxC-x17-CxxC domain-containing protein